MPEAPLIIRAGKSICPTEIEAVLNDHPAVAEAVVVGVPDPFWGQIVAAAVRLSGRTPEAAAELTKHCLGSLAPFKVPTRWLFVSHLPRTDEGHPCRATLCAHLAVTSRLHRPSWVAQWPSAVAGPPALDPLLIFRQVTDTKNLRLPQQRESCGLEGLDYP